MHVLSLGELLQKKFIGTDDLRKKLTNILERLPEEGGEVVITQHGKPQAVLLDLESYIELQEQLADSDPNLIKEVNQAISEIKKGKGVAADKVFKDLGL